MTWKEYRLEEVVDFFDNERIPLSTIEREKRQGPYPYYGAQGVIDHINDFIFDGEYVLVAEDGANLVTRQQPIAQIASGKFWVNNHAHVIRAKSDVSMNYFVLTLLNFFNLTGYVTGAAQPKLSQKNLKIVKVELPNLEEQKSICRVLSAYDDLIENNRRRIQLLEQAARLLFKEWFVHLRFPGHEHVKIKDGVPEAWEKVTIGDLGKVVTGKTPSKKHADNFDGQVPFIKTPDMHNTILVVETDESLSEKGASSQPRKTLPPRSILVSCIGTVGVVSLNASEAQTNQQINSLRLDDPVATCWAFFMAKDLKPVLEGMSGGATMANVSKGKFANIGLILPPRRLLRQYQNFAEPIIDQVEILERQNISLRRARDLLLPRLMSGEITV